MKHVTYTELRSNLAAVLDEAEADRTEVIITRQGHAPAVLMALSEWEGMKETLHLLSRPNNARLLLQSIKDADEGKTFERELVEP